MTCRVQSTPLPTHPKGVRSEFAELALLFSRPERALSGPSVVTVELGRSSGALALEAWQLSCQAAVRAILDHC